MMRPTFGSLEDKAAMQREAKRVRLVDAAIRELTPIRGEVNRCPDCRALPHEDQGTWVCATQHHRCYPESVRKFRLDVLNEAMRRLDAEAEA